MGLGSLGGESPQIFGVSGGSGTEAAPGLLNEARDQLTPSPEGMPALSNQLAQLLAGYGGNLLTQGSFESWSSGTSSDPDGWVSSGAGVSVAQNVTSGQIQDGSASCNLVAALNTITRLSQTISISATKNTRLRSKQVVFSAQVLASSASRVSLEIDDGVQVVTGLQHTGSGVFETLTVTVTLNSAATQIKCSLLISSGASITATIDAAKLEEGSTATSFVQNPNDSFIQPRSLLDTNADTTVSATTVDMGSVSIANVILNGNQSVIATLNLTWQNNGAGNRNSFAIFRGSNQVGIGVNFVNPSASQDYPANIAVIDPKPAAGNYTYKSTWSTGGGTLSSSSKALSIAIIPSA